jgi:hypothetical protein
MFAKIQIICYMYVIISINMVFLLPFCRSNCFARRLQHQAVEVSTQFQITKHLNLVVLLQIAKTFLGVLNLRL